jgi:hypothetical protein
MSDYRVAMSVRKRRQSGSEHRVDLHWRMVLWRCHSAVQVAGDVAVVDGTADIPARQVQKIGPKSTPKNEATLERVVADVRELHEGWHTQNERPSASRAVQNIRSRQMSRVADDATAVLSASGYLPLWESMQGNRNRGSKKDHLYES